jgi:hypothetical protein
MFASGDDTLDVWCIVRCRPKKRKVIYLFKAYFFTSYCIALSQTLNLMMITQEWKHWQSR